MKGIAEIEYFVFTDNMNLSTADNVTLLYQECKGFPMDSLFRFDMFLSIKKELMRFDYTFFFNANMLFVDSVGMEFLPQKEGLMAVLHPGYYNKIAALFPYERNKKSTAYIPPFKKSCHYYMGAVNGGKTIEYMRLITSCSKNIHTDYDMNYIAVFHDESHLNKYLSEHSCLALSPAYCYPEDKQLPFDPKILIRDKVKLDHYFNKGRDFSLKGRIKRAWWVICHIILWYI